MENKNNLTNQAKRRVALGMSGGVDSTVAAHLLVEQGYEVTGVFLECWRAPGCRAEEDRKDALRAALDLGIPFEVLDFKDVYKQRVVEYFFAEYQAGRTPNPDVLCNKEIKFGLFYDWAKKLGFDLVATGHYAKIIDSDGRLNLAIPTDKHKDQTYFLYLLSQPQLKNILFPLANLTKQQVRQKAAELSLPNAQKKDSVGICFIGDIDVRAFLKDRLGEKTGEVVDVDGNVIGRHNGHWFYTIGQRHGFTIDKKTLMKLDDGSTLAKDNIPPFYVISKNADQNQIVVGFGPDTYQNSFSVDNLHLIDPTFDLTDLKNDLLKSTNQLLVRIRHTGELMPCTVRPAEVDANQNPNSNSHRYQVTLTHPVKGIAAGQSAVFYLATDQATICLGGGVIS